MVFSSPPSDPGPLDAALSAAILNALPGPHQLLAGLQISALAELKITPEMFAMSPAWSRAYSGIVEQWESAVHAEFRRLASGPLVGVKTGAYRDSLRSDNVGGNQFQRRVTFWSTDPKAELIEKGSKGPWWIVAKNPRKDGEPALVFQYGGKMYYRSHVLHPQAPARKVIETAVRNAIKNAHKLSFGSSTEGRNFRQF